MINHYSLLQEFARLRQQEMLRQAETERLYKQLKGNRPGLLQQIGHHLADVARQLKTYTQSSPATPILGHK
jgi:hypothetical protein